MNDATQPATADDLFALGNAFANRGQYEDAIACFERVRLLMPFSPTVYNNLGAALMRLQRYDAAIERYQQALALDPANFDILHNLGCAYEQTQQLEAALDCYGRALAHNPRLHVTNNNMGNVLNALGRFEQAHAAYRQAIQLQPLNATYYRNLVQSKRLSVDDPCFIGMQLLAQQIDQLDVGSQLELHFALGQALDDMGQHEAAFEHFLRGNRLYRSRSKYDETLMLGLFEDTARTFTAEWLAQVAPGCDTDAPIFIVGMPRSGSSLIEQILSSHPSAFGAGERPDFPRALAEFMGAGSGAPLNITQLDAAQCQALGADYLRRLKKAPGANGGFTHLIDKYPFNFSLLGVIHMALPKARFIHSRRSPVDTCLSCYSRVFHDVPFCYDLGELGRYYRAYDALMAHWRAVLPPGVLLDVDYEALVTDFKPQVQRMLDHCGLEWNDACVNFHETRRQVVTASAAQVRRPLFDTSLARWRPAPELLQPLLDGLGERLCMTEKMGMKHG
jgi:tetratricopeptide (TPR) repeat protein